MRFTELIVRSFRNLKDTRLEAGPEGAVLLGANGEGKTSLLEAIYFPVLFRSLRGASDQEIVRFGEPGFHVALRFEAREQSHHAAVTYRAALRWAAAHGQAGAALRIASMVPLTHHRGGRRAEILQRLSQADQAGRR